MTEYMSSSTTTFLQLQSQRLCGSRQNNGRRCTNPWVDSVPVDPDQPEGDKIGACGVHMAEMLADLKRLHDTRNRSSIERYVDFENRRLVRALNIAGIMTELRGYSSNQYMVFLNPNEIVSRLTDLGVLRDFDLRGMCREGPHVKDCGPGDDDNHCYCGCETRQPYYGREEKLKNCWDPPEEVKADDGQGTQFRTEGLRPL